MADHQANNQGAAAPAPALPGSDYRALGRFIIDQSPYGRDYTYPQLDAPDIFEQTDEGPHVLIKIPLAMFGDNHVVTRRGLHEKADADHPVKFIRDEDLEQHYPPEELKKVMHWEYDGREHRVLKALRIWYTYQTPDENKPGTTKPIGAFLLVGFVGNGQP
jgi:hypothetical protein